MTPNNYTVGDTVRLTATFKDWNGKLVDPSSVKVIIYDSRYNKLEEIIVTKEPDTVGIYTCDYVFNTSGDFIYEWNGDINGTPSLTRRRIRTSFE